jgi:hypothetical protein
MVGKIAQHVRDGQKEEKKQRTGLDQLIILQFLILFIFLSDVILLKITRLKGYITVLKTGK